MTKLYETLPLERQLACAVRSKTPTRLAENFAAFVGQFYNRVAFDALARQVNDLYDAERATTFRSQLDRRLYDRYHDPVAWEVTPTDDAAATACPRAA
ncbi:MAG TPA: hypothetical protein VNL16_16725 [Chloroflexota bacterium]|nr:hypothetical protein [Chloroflexota bacterium]